MNRHSRIHSLLLVPAIVSLAAVANAQGPEPGWGDMSPGRCSREVALDCLHATTWASTWNA
jgi:hypothetical protein